MATTLLVAMCLKAKAEGVTRKLAAFTLSERNSTPRIQNCKCRWRRDRRSNFGNYVPMMKVGIGMGYLKPEYTKLGTNIYQVRKET